MSGVLSLRTERALRPRPYYFEKLVDALCDAWSEEENPDGYILAALAENALSSSKILEHLDSNPNTSPLPPEAARYNDAKGWLEFRRLLCGLLQRTTAAGTELFPENLALAAGVNAVLDAAFFALCDPGNAVLIPAPYYPMFDHDLRAKNDVRAWPVHAGQHASLSEALSAGHRAASAARATPRAVLLTNPDNPTGRVYSAAELKEVLRWCLAKRVHCVVDEIYALSVFASEAPAVSAIAVATELAAELSEAQQGELWDHVHIIFGLSKDFCVSGFRVGGLYTYNAQLLAAMDALADFAQVSSVTQWHLMCMLHDEPFVDGFLRDNAAALEDCARAVTRALDDVGVPYARPQAAFFVWADMRERLGIATWERERDIFNALFDTARVFCVPGEACHAEEPGFFRICFTGHSAAGALELGRRLKEFIERYTVFNARQNWNTQSYMLTAGFGTRR